ncbi:HU family DNA-binding protein [Prevotella sp. A2931]|uniref:HU family DNA-binding protein n=1 Tax=Prevotella illustrans TaxID=2800387 RepID=A0ABS3M3R6_9BACT|nr:MULTISPECIES: HU family DNA-binding protein [Prevotella]MBO1362770.1 HU family DNA-binding protein [Prevotella illustrans]PTL25762.1 hypothetical protein C3V39_00925 [Prevotella sp. oral taxon 820]
MMIKINDLIQDVAKEQGLSKVEMEKFVSLMIDVLNEGLQADRLVKVKGLGTFKVASVSARESINVNTGERIIIEGRDKISFTPEATLRDFVNRPFAQFETVTINEGVDIEALNSSETEVAPTEDSQEITNTADVQEIVGATKQEENVCMFAVENEDEVCDEIIEDDKPTDETSTVPNASADEECIMTADSNECNDEENSNVAVQYEVNSQSSQQSLKHIIILLSVLCLVLLCVCVGGFYYMFTQIDQRNQRIDYLMTKIIDSKKTSRVVKSQSIQYSDVKPSTDNASAAAVKQDGTNEGESQDRKVHTLGQKTPMPKPANHLQDTETQKSDAEKNDFSALNKRDVRVRTGAYRIVGVQTTIRVKKGQTLESLSRLYLGPDMECYVEVLNDCKAVKAGDLLKIPALKLKKSR